MLCAGSVTLGNTAESVFEQYHTSIVQVKIIELNAESQSSLGSGFFIAGGNKLATNYHVISSLAMKPDRYRAEIDYGGETHVLRLLDVDVVNDLAILEVPTPGAALKLSELEPEQGSTLFSLGNPHNIGLTVVEGNYNGLVEDRFFDQIHFSGAINPGMSGGPVLSEGGDVVGVNVASAGNQIGFLVPIRYLAELLARINETNAPTDINKTIAHQLDSASELIVNALLEADWSLTELGNAKVLDQIHPAIECWGNSNEKKKLKYFTIAKGCKGRSHIYIDHSFNSGHIEYEFSYYRVEDWPASGFYRSLSKKISGAGPGNASHKDYVGNYQCVDKTVNRESNKIKRKISYCTRAYKKFKGLFDILYVGTSIDRNDEAIVEHFTISGVSKKNAQAFLKHFIEVVRWQ